MNSELDRIVKISVLTVKALEKLGITGIKPDSSSAGSKSDASSGSVTNSEGLHEGCPSDILYHKDEHPYPVNPMMIPTHISTREVSLTPSDAERCFGKDHSFTIDSELSGDGVTVYKEIVTVKGPLGEAAAHLIDVNASKSSVRILNCDKPLLGLEAPIRRVDDLAETPAFKVMGPAGEISLKSGAIVAQRYILVGPEDAKRFDLRRNQVVNVRCVGSRGGILSNVAVILDDNASGPVFFIDAEEADAMNISKGSTVLICPLSYNTDGPY